MKKAVSKFCGDSSEIFYVRAGNLCSKQCSLEGQPFEDFFSNSTYISVILYSGQANEKVAKKVDYCVYFYMQRLSKQLESENLEISS